MNTTTVQVNDCYPLGLVNHAMNSTVCSSSMHQMSLDGTETAGKYVAIVAKNERLKAEIDLLQAHIAELEQQR